MNGFELKLDVVKMANLSVDQGLAFLELQLKYLPRKVDGSSSLTSLAFILMLNMTDIEPSYHVFTDIMCHTSFVYSQSTFARSMWGAIDVGLHGNSARYYLTRPRAPSRPSI
jgi:hypothetical protein